MAPTARGVNLAEMLSGALSEPRRRPEPKPETTADRIERMRRYHVRNIEFSQKSLAMLDELTRMMEANPQIEQFAKLHEDLSNLKREEDTDDDRDDD